MKVFLGGSRRISRLNSAMRDKLEELVRRRMQIIIGDANGADRAMQRQLADWGYQAVQVFHVGRAPRNNVGAWPTRLISTPAQLKGFDFYAAKDLQMAHEAECGLMLWDGVSRGTLANVENLLGAGKPVALYVGPAQRFLALTTADDLEALPEFRLVTQHSAAGAVQSDLGLGDQPSPRSRPRRRTA